MDNAHAIAPGRDDAAVAVAMEAEAQVLVGMPKQDGGRASHPQGGSSGPSYIKISWVERA